MAVASDEAAGIEAERVAVGKEPGGAVDGGGDDDADDDGDADDEDRWLARSSMGWPPKFSKYW